MLRLVYVNIAWNCLVVVMALSEMSGITSIHESLPSWGKWIWLIAMVIGNLIIHALELRWIKRNKPMSNPFSK